MSSLETISTNDSLKIPLDFKVKSIRVVLDKLQDEKYLRNLLTDITDSKIYFTFIKFTNSKETQKKKRLLIKIISASLVILPINSQMLAVEKLIYKLIFLETTIYI